MLFNSPISSQKAVQLVSLLDLVPESHVLDVGCGTGEFLIRVVERTGARGLGIDIQPGLIAKARKAAFERVPHCFLEWHESAIIDANLEDGRFDMVMCLGSTHAFGDGETAYPNAIREMSRLAKPGGQLLVGETYWKQPPAQDYLELIGDPVGTYRDNATNIAIAEETGLRVVYATVSNEDEWDHFEWSHQLELERKRRENPDDPALAERLKRSRAWRDGYLRWGRTTMGFGIYLFTK